MVIDSDPPHTVFIVTLQLLFCAATKFTSKEKLNEFKVKVGTNQGAFAQNQMMMYKQGTKYIEVNEGISDEGSYTLIYILTKMS